MTRLPETRLPKGTRLQLEILLRRCLVLQSNDVRLPRQGVVALQRTIQFLSATTVEGAQ